MNWKILLKAIGRALVLVLFCASGGFTVKILGLGESKTSLIALLCVCLFFLVLSYYCDLMDKGKHKTPESGMSEKTTGHKDLTQENKELLLHDLCARLPYGVKCVFRSTQGDIPSTVVQIDKEAEMVIHRPDGQKIEYFYFIEDGMFKPYLRPLSSMTEKEQEEFVKFHCVNLCPIVITDFLSIENEAKMIDWLNAHQFDYRKTSDGKTMIEAGLALEAKEGMYKN